MLRTLLIYPYAVIITAYYASKALLIRRSDPKVSCTCEQIARTWSLKLLKAAGATVEIKGLEGFDPEKPHILVANHQSWFDVFAMAGHLPANFRFVAKAELSKIPIFGPAWVKCGHVSIDRKDRQSAIESITEAGRRMHEENLTIALYPEGTRSADGRLQPFKKGAFVLAIQSGVPIVPIAIVGSDKVMPKGKWKINPGHIEIRIGESIPVEGLELADRDTLLKSAWEAVRLLKGEELTAENAA